jgi:hypothetical protein
MCILPRTDLTTGYNIVPGGAHFYSCLMLLFRDIVKMETFAFLEVRGYPTICGGVDGIEAVYRLPQKLIIRNHNLQSGTSDAPFGECHASFRKCSNGAIIGKRRSASAQEQTVHTFMGAKYSNAGGHTRDHGLHATASPLIRNREQVGHNGADENANETKESREHGLSLPFIMLNRRASFTATTRMRHNCTLIRC